MSNGSKRRIFPAALLLSLLSLGQVKAARADDAPILPPVPAGHPRVYVQPADVAAIQQKLTIQEFNDDYVYITSGGVSGGTPFGPCPYSVCFAFRALMDSANYESLCQTAIGLATEELGDATEYHTESLRKLNNPMHYGALVYDWCYSELNELQRQDFVFNFVRIAGLSPFGYPADPDDPEVQAVTGHGSESWLLTSQLPAGVAIFDENQQMYRTAATLFLSRFAEVRDFFYPSHMHHQGDSYITSRFQNDQLASWLFARMGAGDVLSTEQRYVPYQLIYNLRPDLQQVRMGDTWDSEGRSPDKKRLVMLTGSYYDDPYLLYMAENDVFRDYYYDRGIYDNSYFDRILRLLFKGTQTATSSIDGLPLTKYFGEPMCEMVARTGWSLGADESNDAVARMRIGQYFFGTHQRKDFGTWQIYYRGALAVSSGFYAHMGCNEPHFKNYYAQTIAQNGLLILDPDEQMMRDGEIVANDGGQHWVGPQGMTFARTLDQMLSEGFEMGHVTGREFGPDPVRPEYSYISGDITAAYSAAKASLVMRSMAALDTSDPTFPLILVIFDRVVSTEPGFRKTWLMHTIEEPAIDEETITVTRYDQEKGYNGKLVAECLLPHDSAISKIGGEGYRFWIPDPQGGGGTNWNQWGDDDPVEVDEIGSWRIEVSPTARTSQAEFLHVMTVMETGTEAPDAAELFESEELVGAGKHGRLVLFARSNAQLPRTSFDLHGDAPLNTLICGLQAGEWCITRNEVDERAISVDAEGTCLYFTAQPGSYYLRQSAECALPVLDGGIVPDAAEIEGDGSSFDAAETTASDSGCGCASSGSGSSSTFLLFMAVMAFVFLTLLKRRL